MLEIKYVLPDVDLEWACNIAHQHVSISEKPTYGHQSKMQQTGLLASSVALMKLTLSSLKNSAS
jgi:hypothetical protein